MNLVLPGVDAPPRDHDLSQWFTPPELAQRVVAWAGVDRVENEYAPRVLEPSAGNGALVRPLVDAGAWVTAVELDPRYVGVLAKLLNKCEEHAVLCPKNFLEFEPLPYDLCVMNCPYEDGLDVAFIRHALAFAPRVVGIFRSAIVHGEERYDTLWRRVDIVRGKWLRWRPQFGKGEKSDGARSDFCVLELRERERSRELDEDMNLRFGWW